MELLPRELVSKVLSRLSAKELMSCKCVCKSWFDLITDPLFISNYYVSYNNSQDEKILVILVPKPKEAEISIVSWNPNEPKGLVSSQSLNLPPYKYKFWYSIMGPCNGIYCLRSDLNTCVIMNPSLGQFIALPQSHFGTYTSSYPKFGFDPKTNDYKVVVLKYNWLEKLKVVLRVELYSLNSNSWRNLGSNAIPFPFEIGGSSSCLTYVNNCCHWPGYDYRNKDDDVLEVVVLSFDLVNELFRKIKTPQITHSSGPCSKYLTAFIESATIGFVVYPAYPASQGTEICFCFDVWVMKDYWDDNSWIKQYSIGPLPVIYNQLMGFYGSNRFYWEDANDRLVLYDPHCENQTMNLRVCRKFEIASVARYMESLVSLKRENRSSTSCHE